MCADIEQQEQKKSNEERIAVNRMPLKQKVPTKLRIKKFASGEPTKKIISPPKKPNSPTPNAVGSKPESSAADKIASTLLNKAFMSAGNFSTHKSNGNGKITLSINLTYKIRTKLHFETTEVSAYKLSQACAQQRTKRKACISSNFLSSGPTLHCTSMPMSHQPST